METADSDEKTEVCSNSLKGISVIKVLRYTAWLLVVATFLTLFSGFFMTMIPSIDYTLSRTIHVYLLPLLFIPLFYLHSLAGILFALCRRGYAKNTKVKVSVGILWTLLFVSFIFFYMSGTSIPPLGTSVISTTSETVLSITEVAKHNSASDCWVIIGNNVYDITNYLPYHPRGPSVILPYCGKDATSAFETRGGIGPNHSPYAYSLLSNYLLGAVGSNLARNTTVQ